MLAGQEWSGKFADRLSRILGRRRFADARACLAGEPGIRGILDQNHILLLQSLLRQFIGVPGVFGGQAPHPGRRSWRRFDNAA